MSVRGLLIDLEGVLYLNGAAIDGAADALRRVRSRGLSLRFLTNTTTTNRARVVASMEAMGFDVAAAEVLTPAIAAGGFLAARGVTRIHLAAAADLAEDFDSFQQVQENPEAVVLGDLHTGFTWQRLDGLFAMLRDGAELVALHKNRYCRRGGSLSLDLGPFVAALEYAARRSAHVMGKPNAAFFASALADLGLPAAAVMMVGDDMDADIGGALESGLRAVQVRTGKYVTEDERRPGPQPETRIGSIADLPLLLERMG